MPTLPPLFSPLVVVVGGGGGVPLAPKSGLPRAEGTRFTKNFENLKVFEKLWLKNATKMNLGDLLNKFSLNFFYEKCLI